MDVLVAHGGQADRIVLFRVLLVTDADEGRFEKAHDRGKHLCLWKAGELKVSFDAAANGGQRTAERAHTLVFHLIADSAVEGMVSILFAPAGIPAECLKMAEGRGTDPNISPGGRDH